MELPTLEQQVAEYCRMSHEVLMVYDEIAKSLGVSYTNMFVLYIIYDNRESCTQKTICQIALLPKQTVNVIITGFLKQGLIELAEMKEDRRTKRITFTKKGLDYVTGIVPKIKDAERRALANFNDHERAALIESTRRYIAQFREGMRANFAPAAE